MRTEKVREYVSQLWIVLDWVPFTTGGAHYDGADSGYAEHPCCLFFKKRRLVALTFCPPAFFAELVIAFGRQCVDEATAAGTAFDVLSQR